MMQNWWILVFGVIAGAQAQSPQAGTGQGPPRAYTISPQVAAKLQQQQHLQQIHQQQQQQQHQHPQPNSPPPQFHPQPQPQRPAPPPQSKPSPSHSQPPKYVTRNNLDAEGYQKPRFQAPPSKPQPVKQQQPLSKEEEEDYYEDELPDKLTLLLQKSKFECSSKKDGYYADETLNCEVFHYCQDAKKHSWMCPESMNFHQVHLICMPPSQDNICTKSANYHFVNEYLYRPINEKEAASTNTSLKYADRYYPQGYTPGMAIDELQEQQPYQPRAPQRFGHQNVFFNPESVNIPLTQRRPPSRQQQQKQQSQSIEYYDE